MAKPAAPSAPQEMPRVGMFSRFHAFVHVAPVFVWVLIAALKICIEFMFHAVDHPFGERFDPSAPLDRGMLLQAGARLVALLVVMGGLLSVLTVCIALVVDLMASESKPHYALRASLHNLVQTGSRTAWAPLVVSLLALPSLCVGVSVLAVRYWQAHECVSCAQPGDSVCACIGAQCSSLCDLAQNALMASVLVAVVVLGSWLRTLPDVGQSNHRLQEIFAAFDENFSGVINADELRAKTGMSAADARDAMKEFDDNADGELDFAEFQELVELRFPNGLGKPDGAAPATRSSLSVIICNPDLWTRFMARVLSGFALVSLAILLALVPVATNGLAAVATFLIVCCLQTVIFSTYWLVVLGAHSVWVLCCQQSWAMLVGSVVAQVAVPLALARAVPAYGRPFALVVISGSLFTMLMFRARRAAVTNELFRTRGFRLGSLAVAALFAPMIFLFVSSALQVSSGTRGTLPDAFAVRPYSDMPALTNSTLALHTVLGSASLAKADVRIKPREAASGAPHPGVAPSHTCTSRTYGLSLQDAALFSQLAYLDCGAPGFEAYRRAFFPDFDVVYGCEERQRLVENTGSAVFYHFFSAERDLHVLAVRGTHILDLNDMARDVDIWIEAVLFSTLGNLFAGLRLWPPTLISELIAHAAHIDGTMLEVDRHYHQSLVDYGRTIAADRRLVIGHSLGGGLAKIVGAKLKIPAIAISGPGIVDSHRKFGVEILDINQHIVNLVPSFDVVPTLGVLGGTVHNIICTAQRPDICHQPFYAICYLQHICGAQPDGAIADCHFQALA